MNYKEKVEQLLQENLTDKGFKLWSGINKMLPDIWEKSTSSTGKWHKKLNGEIPSQAEHIYQLLYTASKIMRMFNIEKNTSDGDMLLLAIALHDSLKYGQLGNRPYTDNKHDKLAADMVCENKETFLKLLTEEQFGYMQEAIRFHSGQWSTDAKFEQPFSFKNHTPYTIFVHILDMLSTADCLQTDVRD